MKSVRRHTQLVPFRNLGVDVLDRPLGVDTPRPTKRTLKGAVKDWPLGHSAQRIPGFSPGGFHFLRSLREPSLDVTERDNRVIVKAEVPGMQEKDIHVRFDGGVLTISGEKSAKREIRKKGTYYFESKFGVVQHVTRLPEGVSKDSKKTHYKDGVLTVEFLKK